MLLDMCKVTMSMFIAVALFLGLTVGIIWFAYHFWIEAAYPHQHALEDALRNAQVVKVCTDGSRVYYLADGRGVVSNKYGGWVAMVANVNTVCAARP